MIDSWSNFTASSALADLGWGLSVRLSNNEMIAVAPKMMGPASGMNRASAPTVDKIAVVVGTET